MCHGFRLYVNGADRRRLSQMVECIMNLSIRYASQTIRGALLAHTECLLGTGDVNNNRPTVHQTIFED